MRAPDELVRLAFNTLDSEVAIVDSDGVIVYTNDTWEEFAHDSDYEGDPGMIGENYLSVCKASADDEPYAREAADGIQSLFDGTQDRFQMEYPCPTEDNSSAWFLMWATTFDFEGKQYVLVEHMDISERKEIERKIVDRNERLSTVSSVLSHDLRNPMSVALGHAELLEDDPSPEHAREIVAALNRMDSIVDDAVTLAKQELEDIEVVELIPVIEDVWNLIDTEHATLERTESLTFEADRSILQGIFQNLFRNAIEHGGSNVTISVGALEDRPGFYVEDDGPGVPQDYRENVFEPGFSSNTTAENSGLGLSIVNNAVMLHDWEITLTDGTDGGARFEIQVADEHAFYTLDGEVLQT